MQACQDGYKSGIYPRSLAVYPPAVRMHLVHPLAPMRDLRNKTQLTTLGWLLPKPKKIPGNAKPICVTKVGGISYDEPLIFDSISACLRHFKQIPAKGTPRCNLRSALERWAMNHEVDFTFI